MPGFAATRSPRLGAARIAGRDRLARSARRRCVRRSTSTRRRRRRPPRRPGSFNLRTDETRLLPVGRTPFLLAELTPGPDRQHAEPEPGHHRRRPRLRQRVPGRRRGRQRQRLRPAERPLHRGRHPGSAGADLGRRRRVRPLRRRRRQRGHAQRRQRLLGRVPHQPVEPGVERGNAVREVRRARRAPSKLSPTYEGDRRRPGDEGPPVVLRRHARRAHDDREPAAA